LSSFDWLPLFRAIAADVRSKVIPVAGTARGLEEVGQGAGGDRTVFLDELAEETVVAHLEEAYRSGSRFRLISEELGERDYGGEDLILVDPLDGSLNAKYGLPYFSIVLAVADGDRLRDVRLGYVANLVSGAEFHAVAGQGAKLNGAPLTTLEPARRNGRFGVLQLDGQRPAAGLQKIGALLERAERLRILGSAALNVCHTAVGGISLQVAPVPVRSFDLAGPLLILREAGGVASDLDGRPLDDVLSTLESRTTVLAAHSPDDHSRALALLHGEG
jgi:myo-inositol-1(or 4)-monophosphatase